MGATSLANVTALVDEDLAAPSVASAAIEDPDIARKAPSASTPAPARRDTPLTLEFSIGSLLSLLAAWSAVALGSAENHLPIQVNSAGVHQVRSILRGVAIDHELVPDLHFALPETLARQLTRRGAFTAPRDHVALVILDVDIEVGVRVGPFHLGQRTLDPDRLVAVELRGKGMMSDCWNRR